MLPNKDDIIESLNSLKIIGNGQQINDLVFKELLFASFLGCISHERINRFWKQDYLEEVNFKDKHEKIMHYFHLPFHFVGFDKKTAFITEKDFKDRIFNEEFTPSLITSYQDIEFFKKPFPDLTSEVIYQSHNKQHQVGYCPECKKFTISELLNRSGLFFKSINVRSYIIIDLPIEIINNFIFEDDLIEEEEENKCKNCEKLILPHFNFCPICGKKIEKQSINEKPKREKMFNILLSIYLSYKHKITNFDANKYLNNSTSEIDVILKNNNKSLAIENTTQINLSKEYITKKIHSLLMIDALENHKNNSMILWSLDKNCDSSINKDYFKGIFNTDKFVILPSKLSKSVLRGHVISIKQEELNIIKDAFFKELESLDYYLIKNLK